MMINKPNRIVTVTPELALEWRKSNPRIRRLDEKRVQMILREIRNGAWHRTGKPLGFLVTRGQTILFDGHHRCEAIFRSGKTVRTDAFYTDDKRVLDWTDVNQKTRTDRDIVQLGDERNDYSNPALAVAIANGMMWGFSPQFIYSSREKKAFRKRYRDDLRWACKQFSRDAPKIKTAPLMAACVMAIQHEERKRVERFIEILYTGEYEDDSDLAAVVLRNSLLLKMPHAARPKRSLIFRKTLRALELFCAHQPITKIYACNGNPYPLPE